MNLQTVASFEKIGKTRPLAASNLILQEAKASGPLPDAIV